MQISTTSKELRSYAMLCFIIRSYPYLLSPDLPFPPIPMFLLFLLQLHALCVKVQINVHHTPMYSPPLTIDRAFFLSPKMHGKLGYMAVRKYVSTSNPNIYDRETAEAVAGVTGIVSGAAVSAPFLAGFTSGGVAAGSAAAAAQATIGNVVAGSAFSMAQNVAATTVLGTAAAPVLGVGLVVGGAYMLVRKRS